MINSNDAGIWLFINVKKLVGDSIERLNNADVHGMDIDYFRHNIYDVIKNKLRLKIKEDDVGGYYSLSNEVLDYRKAETIFNQLRLIIHENEIRTIENDARQMDDYSREELLNMLVYFKKEIKKLEENKSRSLDEETAFANYHKALRRVKSATQRKSTTTGTTKQPRLKLSPNAREVLNDKIVTEINDYIDAGKGTINQACAYLSGVSKKKLGYELSEKAIEGRYWRSPERRNLK